MVQAEIEFYSEPRISCLEAESLLEERHGHSKNQNSSRRFAQNQFDSAFYTNMLSVQLKMKRKIAARQ